MMAKRSLLLLGLLVGGVQSFAPQSAQPLSRQYSLIREQRTRIQVVPPEFIETITTNTHLLLSDAAAQAAQQDEGWWNSYINIFKIALEFVHTTIDGPLRSIGVEQTWGISIAVFTALIRSALLPLSIQQSKSAEYMKALRPYVSEIREKYKGNEDAQNRAIGQLYQDANQNPLAGCLFSLAQLPVFLGLYRGVRLLAMDNELNEPFLWIPTLEGPVSPPDYRGLDWLLQGWQKSTEGGFPYVPALGWETTLAFLIMPVVLVVLQSITMNALQPPMDDKMSEEEQEQMQTTQRVLKFLPLLIGFFSLQVPAGLTIYWFTSNIYTLSQSLGVKAYYKANPPDIELPDYWESALSGDTDNLSPEEKRKASQAGIQIGPTMEDLVDESKFHSYIERTPLRTSSVAWQRIQENNNNNIEIPTELKSWAETRVTVTNDLLNSNNNKNGATSTTTTDGTTTTKTAAEAVADLVMPFYAENKNITESKETAKTA